MKCMISEYTILALTCN